MIIMINILGSLWKKGIDSSLATSSGHGATWEGESWLLVGPPLVGGVAEEASCLLSFRRHRAFVSCGR